jgi:hypothetical protein
MATQASKRSRSSFCCIAWPSSAYSYQDVVGSMSNRERNGVKYASVRLSPESNGAVFHVLASK